MNVTTESKTVVVVGGVAGGASAAARLRRLSESWRIIVLERSGYVSFANCGLPYHLSATIPERGDLLLQTPESLRERFRLDVRVRNEVLAIDRESQSVRVGDLDTGREYQQKYDALILSPGAAPIVPPVPGADRGLVLRDIEDLDRMVEQLQGARDVVVVGGGFIGLEAAENLAEAGKKVTVVELSDQLLAPLDPEMARPLEREFRRHGVALELGRSVAAVGKDDVHLDDGRRLSADVVVFAIGVRPDAHLAAAAGLALGPRGGIVVDDRQRTEDPHIWAVGDAVEKTDLIDGEATLTPLANIANRQGRRAADDIAGIARPVLSAQGTAIVKVFNLAAATTGWNEKRLRLAGREFVAIHTHANDHAGYYPGATTLALKLLIDPDSGAILGAQAVGRDGADKRIDVLATAMRGGLTATDLIDLELAYAPPYGSAKDPINQLGYIAENRLTGLTASVDWSEVDLLNEEGWRLLDVRTPEEFAEGAIPGAVNVPVDELRPRIGELAGQQWIVYCAVGQRAHVATQLLTSHGIRASNLDGGWSTWRNTEDGQRPTRRPPSLATTDTAGARS
jgi:NADPH-dependent 2,4-dienoyl-CoA reductase/sulfur reductase-like enzyme/rhodanese-related sulfurtransferase